MFRPKVDGPPGLRPGWPPPFDLDATDRPSTVGILRGVLIRENFREYLDHLLHDGCSVRCPQIDRLFACGFIGSRPDTLAIQAQVVPPRWQATLMLFNSRRHRPTMRTGHRRGIGGGHWADDQPGRRAPDRSPCS